MAARYTLRRELALFGGFRDEPSRTLWRTFRMKYAAAAAAAAIALIGAAAVAQTTTPAAPAPPPPPSACPVYPTPPTVPTEAQLKTTKDLNAGTEKVNAYLGAYQTVHNCRIAEIDRLKAHAEARVAEAKSGQDAALALRNSWQATGDAFNARAATKTQKDNRSGR